MIEGAILLLTAAPVVLLAMVGYRVGTWRLVTTVAVACLPWTLALASAWLAVHQRWFAPFGLVTPFVFGLGSATLGWCVARRVGQRREAGGVTAPMRIRGRICGSVLGAALGLMVAAWLWTAGALVAALAAPDAPPPHDSTAGDDDAVARLFRTAHRGFVRHLPWIGPLADDVDALITIVGADEDLQREFARRRGWQRLADLPAIQAILRDEDLMRDVGRIGAGDLQALYRLQRDARVLAACDDRELWSIVGDTSPTALAHELTELGRTLARPR